MGTQFRHELTDLQLLAYVVGKSLREKLRKFRNTVARLARTRDGLGCPRLGELAQPLAEEVRLAEKLLEPLDCAGGQVAQLGHNFGEEFFHGGARPQGVCDEFPKLYILEEGLIEDAARDAGDDGAEEPREGSNDNFLGRLLVLCRLIRLQACVWGGIDPVRRSRRTPMRRR